MGESLWAKKKDSVKLIKRAKRSPERKKERREETKGLTKSRNHLLADINEDKCCTCDINCAAVFGLAKRFFIHETRLSEKEERRISHLVLKLIVSLRRIYKYGWEERYYH